MSSNLTPVQLAERTERAVNAAVAAGRGLGLTVAEPVVLYDVFSVVVHLAPSPVVVRVPMVLAPGAEVDDQIQLQRNELDVVRWLADRGVPVVPPSPLVPLEPVRRDGFAMTLWQLIETDPDIEPDYVAASGLAADLHAELRDYPGELPFLEAGKPMIELSRAELATRPDLLAPEDLDRVLREWEVLGPLVASREAFEAAFPGVDIQVIHGDCPPANLLWTKNGPLFGDFELVKRGPVEWDLATLGPECEAAYNATARGRGLRALDDRVMRLMNAVGQTRTVSCLALVPQLPMLAEAMAPAIEAWRAGPFAGGVGQ